MLRKIFVYGSLNTPSNKFSRRLVKNSEQLWRGEIAGRLYYIGNYPGAVESNSAHKIYGKIYRINNANIFSELDKYEEYNKTQPQKSLFIRKAVLVKDNKGKIHRAWVYFYNRPVKAKKLIKRGDYRKFKKTKYIQRRKKFHRRKQKIVPQLPPAYGLLNTMRKAAINPRYHASRVGRVNLFHPTGNNHRMLNPYTKGVSPFSQYWG